MNRTLVTRQTAEWKVVLCLAVYAFVFFAIGAGWGAPTATAPDRVQSWGIDDESPLGPLTEVHNIVEPKPDQWLSYPLLYSFVTAVVYAPYMLFLLLTGRLEEISAVYPFGLTDPVGTLRTLTWMAHLVSATMGALVVAASYDIGRTLWDRRTGLLAGVWVSFSFPLVYYARNGNVDAMAMGFVALTVAAFVRAVVYGFDTRRAVWLGLFAGLALASKESSVGVFLAMPVVLLVEQARLHGGTEGLRARAFWKAAGVGLLIAFLAFGVGSGLFIDPDRYIAHVQYLRGLLEKVSSADTAAVYAFPYTLSGHLGYLKATLENFVDALTLPGLLLAGAGVALAFRQRSRAVFVAVLVLSYVVYLFVSYRLVQVRYLMPAYVFLLIFAAYAVVRALRARHWLPRAAGAVLGVLALGSLFLNAVDLTYQMLYDSRYEAAAWLAKHTAPGDTIEYFGPVSKLPALKAGVTTVLATEYQGMYVPARTDPAKVNEILQSWRERRPKFIIIMPDHTTPPPTPYSHTVPPQLYEQMLSDEGPYRLAARFETPSLFPWLPEPALDYQVVNPPIRIFAAKEEREP